jgi:cell division protein FtsB
MQFMQGVAHLANYLNFHFLVGWVECFLRNPAWHINMFTKVIIFLLFISIVLLQYRLWMGDGSVSKTHLYQYQLDNLNKAIAIKQKRNNALAEEVDNLRLGKEAIEEIARYDLGMLKRNETFIQIIEPSK